VLAKWVGAGHVRPCLVADRSFASSRGQRAGIPDDLAPEIRRGLQARGIESLHSHQAAALTAAKSGRHLVVATPTASGKSLCFHLPILDALAKDPESTAIYLFPTKALSRDQESSVRELVAATGLPIPAVVYDGDTPGDARRVARAKTNLLMTNPDMLHSGILPHHPSWARLFSKLKYVVVDELHTYRGVFGSHVAHVLGRLQRVAAFHGSRPTFLTATATIGNPREHAARIIGVPPEDVTLLSESGAPTGERRVFLYNPPVVNAELGIRASYLKSAVRLTADLLRARVPTIVFGPSRNSVEIMLKYLRDALHGVIPDDAIMAYRGGYLPDTRRRIERGLREGAILGVVATNALELGIDIGDLDAVVCASYPGSVAATWQRFGRAGRRGKLSAAILVTASHAIDQYLAKTPEYVLDGSIEEARIDPANTEILIQHLKCAAFELPFVDGERYGGLPAEETTMALRFLAEKGVVHEQGGRFHWTADRYPANHVSLRSVGWDNTVIIDKTTGTTIGELDWRATPTMLHEQAIYQHDGVEYQVEQLDHENHKAFVRQVEPDYFTTAMTNRKVTPLDTERETSLYRGHGVLGEISVVEKVVGFKKIKFFTHENAGYGEVRLPDVTMHTTSFWWTVPAAVCLDAGLSRGAALDGLRGILRALETVATLALMCDPRDIGQSIEDGELGGALPPTESATPSPVSQFDPTLFLFDNVPGGIGLAPRIFEQAPELLRRVRGLLRACECDFGCPLCVGAVEADVVVPPSANDGASARGRRGAAIRLLDRLLLDA